MDYEERRRARFDAKVDKSGECWIWTGGGCGVGYGGFAWDARKGSEQRMPAHRAAWMLLVGPIPDGMTIDHTCNERRCVRPDHLQVVTMRENIRLAVERRTTCRRGHERNEKNTRERVRPYKGGTRIVRSCRVCDREDKKNASKC